MNNYSNYLGARRCCNNNLATTVSGPQGQKGSQGPIGPIGHQGVTGSTGSQGATGACCRGPQGFQGNPGDFGGPTGAQGDTGPTGSQGSTGAQGNTGGSPWFSTNYIGVTGPGYTGTGYTGDVMVFGGLHVSGGIDPTYLALEPQSSNPFYTPGTTGLYGIWVDSANGNSLRSDNIYMNVESTTSYISLKPDNTNQIILNDGATPNALSNIINYSSITLDDPGNNINNSITSGYIQIIETSGNITNGTLFNSTNISSTQTDITAQTNQSSELTQGSISCYANINNGGTEGILTLSSNPNPIFGASIDYTKNGSGVAIQNYLPFKYNNSEIFRYDANGVTIESTKYLAPNRLYLPTTTTSATGTTTITIAGNINTSFKSYQIGYTGTTTTVTTLTITNMPINATYDVAIYNGGSGNLTINSSLLGTGGAIKTTYTSAIVIPTLRSAIMTIKSLAFTTGGTIYVVSVSLLTP